MGSSFSTYLSKKLDGPSLVTYRLIARVRVVAYLFVRDTIHIPLDVLDQPLGEDKLDTRRPSIGLNSVYVLTL